jgi:hypothetical protein
VKVEVKFFQAVIPCGVQHEDGGSKVLQNVILSARVYPRVPGLAAWSENCKWYSSLPLGAVVSLFCESV